MFYFIIWVILRLILLPLYIIRIPGLLIILSIEASNWYRWLKDNIPCKYGGWFHDWECTSEYSTKVCTLGRFIDGEVIPVRFTDKDCYPFSTDKVYKRVCLKCGECDFPEQKYLKQVEKREEKNEMSGKKHDIGKILPTILKT